MFEFEKKVSKTTHNLEYESCNRERQGNAVERFVLFSSKLTNYRQTKKNIFLKLITIFYLKTNLSIDFF